MGENRVCAAIDCFHDAITEFSDGAGRVHWLCEKHGDELAVGFFVKRPEVCWECGFHAGQHSEQCQQEDQ